MRVRGAKDGARLTLRFDVDGEPFERIRSYQSLEEAERAADSAIQEVIGDGFVQVPAWEELLERIVTYWREEDPSFDAATLRRGVLALVSPPAAAVMGAIENLSEVWTRREDGSSVLEWTPERDEAAQEFLGKHFPATLPALVLAMRHPDGSAESKVASILAAKEDERVLPALLSVLQHPASNASANRGGRPTGCVTGVFHALGRPNEDTKSAVIAMLDHSDLAQVSTAAVLLAPYADDDRVFEALWAHRDSHHIMVVLPRVVPLRREPELRAALEDFVDCGARWPRLRDERETVANAVRELKAKRVW